MTYRLISKEHLSDGFLRVFTGEINDGISTLLEPSIPEAERVHEVRRHIKRIRSVLILLKEELGKDRFKRESSWYKETAHELSPIRDEEVIKCTILTLLNAAHLDARTILKHAFPLLGATIRTQNRESFLSLEKLNSIVSRLQQGKQRISKWPTLSDKPVSYLKTLGGTYRSGRKLYKKACKLPSIDIFHRWRRDIKYLYFQLILQPKYSQATKKEIRILEKLGSILGDFHDLVLVTKFLDADIKEGFSNKVLEILRERIAKKEKKLVKDASRLGRRVFSDKTETFVKKHKRKIFVRMGAPRTND